MFAKIAKRFRSSKESNSEEQELRVHTRYQFPSTEKLALLWLDDKNSLPVKDLSYGGVQVALSEEKLEAIGDQGVFASLELLFDSRTVHLQPIYARGGHVGFSFVHETSETLIFLRDILEYIRIGKTMIEPPKNAMKESSDDSQTIKNRRFLGEGGSFLVTAESDEEGALSLVHMGFKSGGHSQELLLRDNHIQTAIQSSPSNAMDLANEISPTHHLDPRMIKQAMAISIGLEDEVLGAKLRHELLVHWRSSQQQRSA